MLEEMMNAPIIKQGMCLYDGCVEYKVIIIRWHTRYGTGDYEDPVEIRNDQEVECFYVYYENVTVKGEYNAGGGCYLTLEEAVKAVEAKTIVRWLV